MLDRQLAAAAEATSTEAPTLAMCSSVALAAALPFVGFGFLDNFIMVWLQLHHDLCRSTASHVCLWA